MCVRLLAQRLDPTSRWLRGTDVALPQYRWLCWGDEEYGVLRFLCVWPTCTRGGGQTRCWSDWRGWRIISPCHLFGPSQIDFTLVFIITITAVLDQNNVNSFITSSPLTCPDFSIWWLDRRRRFISLVRSEWKSKLNWTGGGGRPPLDRSEMVGNRKRIQINSKVIIFWLLDIAVVPFLMLATIRRECLPTYLSNALV